MAVTLNETAFDHAKALIDDDQVVVDERDDWSEHPPSAAEENRFIEKHGMPEYAKWQARHRRRRERGEQGRHKFPYGDFRKVHRCGILAAETSRF